MVMDGFLKLCLTWSFAVYLEYFFSWCDVWRVLGWWPFFKMFLHLFYWSSSLVSTLPFLSLIGLSVRLYFPAHFLVISYSCFMFPWADASSASLARSSMKFALSVLDCSVCLCVLFLCCCFCCSRSAVVNCTFLFLPHLHFVESVCRNTVFLLVFLLSQNFAACAGPHLLDLLPLCV